ncbi:MAG TPA: hypothetical protein VK041_04540 [Opitutales bacterium]|nr:hypothetical protein [Opitutales bacterium]
MRINGMGKRRGRRKRFGWSILFGIALFSLGLVFSGCSPTDSPMPDDELPLPEEEPVTTP